MAQTTTTQVTNREMAIYYIATVLGIPETGVTDDLRLGFCAHYIASMMYFRTGRVIAVLDLGTVTAKDIFDQL